jgi:hypothetical protein
MIMVSGIIQISWKPVSGPPVLIRWVQRQLKWLRDRDAGPDYYGGILQEISTAEVQTLMRIL